MTNRTKIGRCGWARTTTPRGNNNIKTDNGPKSSVIHPRSPSALIVQRHGANGLIASRMVGTARVNCCFFMRFFIKLCTQRVHHMFNEVSFHNRVDNIGTFIIRCVVVKLLFKLFLFFIIFVRNSLFILKTS